MFQFASPYFFLLLPTVVLAGWLVLRRRIRAGLVFSAVSALSTQRTTWRVRVARVLPALYLLGMLLTIIGLARPQTVLSHSRRSADVIAIEMVVDISFSMQALDLSVRTPTGMRYRTRLDAVKEMFTEFVDKRADDLIGLVTFGGYAVTRVPLTTDHEAMHHVLSGIEIPREVYVDGKVVNQEEFLTAVGDALAMGCARLRDAEPTSRVMVLLSDGESNTGAIEPQTGIQIAREMGIKVYTIGIGTPGRTMAPFLGKDIFGRETTQQRPVSLDEELLRTIATETEGRYFNVRDPRGLKEALDDIDELETTRIDRDIYSQYKELFPWFLMPALLLFIAATSLNMLAAKRLI
ncbi:MAG: VWA domain-containing protein [Lentisphaerae bacterium]|nr:VWA domain-containing protein [Lentisphaerota bacterium]